MSASGKEKETVGRPVEPGGVETDRRMGTTPDPNAVAAGPGATTGEVAPARTEIRRWLGHHWADLAAVVSYALVAFWVTGNLWRYPTYGLSTNESDQALFQWMLAHGARVVTRLDNPFFSARMNVPDGVNMMANTSVLAISIPMTPVTLAMGPHLAFTVFLTLALFATPVAWYFVLSRFLQISRFAAWVGAMFCGFAPGMVSHANGHPNIVAQFVVPLIVWRMLRLRERGRWLRNGILLGLLIVWQAFINLEILLLVAVGLGVFVLVASTLRAEFRRDLPTAAAGLAVAAVVALGLLAYPLNILFSGPESYRSLGGLPRKYGADLASFVAFPRRSLAGDADIARRLTQNASEENAFFGWPLVVLVVMLVVWLRHSIAAIALAAVGLVFAVLSLGPEIRLDGRMTGVPSLWAALVDLPVFNSVVPTRWALATVPVIGLLLVLGCERIITLARQHSGTRRTVWFATGTMLAMALLPIVPTPLPAAPLAGTPEFISSGTWRAYTFGGRTVVTLPLPDGGSPDAIRWSAQTRLDMRIPRGYFLGPDGRPDRTMIFSAPGRPTSSLFLSIHKTGQVPKLTTRSRTQLVEDLRYWRAGVVILPPGPYEAAYRQAMTELSGIQPVRSGGVWLWDVRPLVSY